MFIFCSYAITKMSFILNFLQRIMSSIWELLNFSQKTITNKLFIYVKTNNGNTLPVNLDPKWDIKTVKETVAPKLGLEPQEVKIIFAGKELCDTTIIEVKSVVICCALLVRIFLDRSRSAIWANRVYYMPLRYNGHRQSTRRTVLVQFSRKKAPDRSRCAKHFEISS